MITSLEIDDALAADVEAAAKSRGLSFREFTRAALRQAVAAPATGAVQRFMQKTHDFGTHIEAPWTALADLETEDYTGKHLKK